jgi:hypothetical protein
MGMVRVGNVMKEQVIENGKKIHWNSELKATLQKGGRGKVIEGCILVGFRDHCSLSCDITNISYL